MSGYSGHWGLETPVSENVTDGEHLPRDSGYMSGNSGHLCTYIPDKFLETPGLAGNFIRTLFIVIGLILIVLVGSLEHNYHVNTCGSKSLFLVWHSYTQFQNKI
jgi:hypothetical protein